MYCGRIEIGWKAKLLAGVLMALVLIGLGTCVAGVEYAAKHVHITLTRR